MVRRISGRRFSRSRLSPEGPSADGAGGQSNEMDFSLAVLEGVEIVAVTGMMIGGIDSSLAASDNAIQAGRNARQSLHLEQGTLEDPGSGATLEVDEEVIDSEIFWLQYHNVEYVHTGVAAEGQGYSHTVQPNGRVDLTDQQGNGVFTSRNITHSAEAENNNQDISCTVLVEYYLVEFTRLELGFLHIRRS